MSDRRDRPMMTEKEMRKTHENQHGAVKKITPKSNKKKK